MDIYLIALIIFIGLTIIYFMLKPDIVKSLLADNNNNTINVDINKYKASKYPKLILYLLAVCISQFILNTIYLSNKCSGSTKDNIGTAALYTFLPWGFFFGIIIAALYIWPEMKSAFSDVFGYLAVSGGATKFFTDYGVKKDYITEMCNDISVLINPITIENFNDTWANLSNEKINVNFNFTRKIDGLEPAAQLLKLVQLKDNIGEGAWYIYTAIFITSFVYYKMANVGCQLSVSQIKENHDKYIQEQEVNDKKQATANSSQAAIN